MALEEFERAVTTMKPQDQNPTRGHLPYLEGRRSRLEDNSHRGFDIAAR